MIVQKATKQNLFLQGPTKDWMCVSFCVTVDVCVYVLVIL